MPGKKYASELDFLLTDSDWPVFWDKTVNKFSKRKYEENSLYNWLVVAKSGTGVARPENRLPMALHNPLNTRRLQLEMSSGLFWLKIIPIAIRGTILFVPIGTLSPS